MRLIFDIEANGLRDTVTKVWCVVTKDIDTGTIWKWNHTQDKIALFRHLDNADELIGHNIINYDLPVLKDILGWQPIFSEGEITKHCPEITDTLVLSRLFNPDRRKPEGLKGKVGTHSLEAWGLRFGRKKPEHEDWTQFSEEMMHRCVEDVEINHMVYDQLVKEQAKA